MKWLIGCMLGCCLPMFAVGQDIVTELDAMLKDSAKKVAPSVARIETSGGQEAVWGAGKKGPEVMFRRGTGATTGIVVSEDGYIVTSSFNFLGKPTAIFVTVPGQPRMVAKIVGTDPTRMLTMLKVDAKGLPVPKALSRSEMESGQWCAALGRTLNPDLAVNPSISKGIISATNRVWGKAVQTDAKTSPVNYGGPLVDLSGNIYGIVVPISPNSTAETAGFEWYDSGIGFAVPLEDVFKTLPKYKAGTPENPVTLEAGKLGVNFREQDRYSQTITIGTVAPASAAQKAGLQVGDVVIEANGKALYNQASLLHILGPTYAGDKVSLKVKRDDKEMEFKDIELSAVTQVSQTGFLGILPMRDDPELGVEIRFVYPKSPAEQAGLKVGDRIMKVGPKPAGPMPKLPPGASLLRPFAGRDQLAKLLENTRVGTDIQLEVKRKDGKTETISLTLAAAPVDIPEELPEKSSAGLALAPVKNPLPPKKGAPPKKEVDPKPVPKKEDLKTGLQQIKNIGEAGRNFWIYIPENYDPNIAHGIVMWLHPAGRDGRDADDMTALWGQFCEKYHLIMVGSIAGSNTGWVAGESDGVIADLRWVMTNYTIDKQRVIVHGQGVGGQMAFYLGVNHKDTIRGVVAVGAVMANNPKEPVANQPVSFLVIAGAKDPLIKEIQESVNKLTEKKYDAMFREMKLSGKEYLNDDPPIFYEMLRWIETMDRL
ncbi:MAG: PDZ domain-containing protein [Zavarzinella sp.]